MIGRGRTGRRAVFAATWLADPVAEGHGSFDVEELAVDLEQVGPLVGPVVNVIRASRSGDRPAPRA